MDAGAPKPGATAKSEAEYFEQRGLPAPGPHFLQRGRHGLSLPLHLARALLAHPVARRRYLWVCSLQFLVILGLGLFFMKSGQEVAGTVQDGRLARAGRPPPLPIPSLPSLPPLPPLPGAGPQRSAADAADDEVFSEEDLRAAVQSFTEAAKAAGVTLNVELEDSEERAKARAKASAERAKEAWLEAATHLARLKALEAVAPSSPELAQARHEAAAARQKARVAQAQAQAAHARVRMIRDEERTRRRLEQARWREFTVTDLEFWAALLAAMHLVQYVVIALSRDYHDALGRDLSLLTGLEPEDEPLQPRVRLDFSWLAKKMKRRMRALMLLFMGMPLLWLVTWGMPMRSSVFTLLTSAWAAWWYVVFSASKSARAWSDEATAPPPWYVRGWTWLTTHVPGLRWGVPRAYGRFLAAQSRSIHSPVARVEEQPWSFAGLALMRAVGLIPGVKCFVRPLIPVATAHLLEAWRVAHPALPAPVSLPRPAAEQPAPVPAKVANVP